MRLLIPFLLLSLFLPYSHSCLSVFHQDKADKVDVIEQKKHNEVVMEIQMKGKEPSKQPESIIKTESSIKSEANPEINESEIIKAYLKSFGYFEGTSNPQNALKNFQKFMGLNKSGTLDVMTRSAIMRRRCGNRDKSSKQQKIWEKTSINYGIASFPRKIRPADVKELIKQAFAAWEIVIAVEFIEVQTAQTADIIIRFSSMNSINNTDKSRFSVASSTGPLNSTIWLKEDEKWGVFHKQEAEKIDLFLVLVHEIGHVLGLEHSSDSNSVMFPIFERQVGEELPIINSDDVENLRNVYDSHIIPETEVLNAASSESSPDPKCPPAIWTATTTPSNKLLLFADSSVWVFNNKQVYESGPHRLAKLFPGAPDSITVAVCDGKIVALINDRDIYEYEEVDGGFRAVKENPVKLHGRVIFFPSSGFPLTNGTVTLLDGNIYATYSFQTNSPSLLGDKSLKYPNLPEDLRAGVLKNSTTYYMFSTDTVAEYDIKTHKLSKAIEFEKFLSCK